MISKGTYNATPITLGLSDWLGWGEGDVVPSGGVSHPGGSEGEKEMLNFYHVLRCHRGSGECREHLPTLSFQSCCVCVCVYI